MSFLEQYVNLRFRLWTNQIVWVLYEAFPEEGEGVSKKLRQFDDGDVAEVFHEKHKQIYLTWLKQQVEVSERKTNSRPPTVGDTVKALKKEKQDNG